MNECLQVAQHCGVVLFLVDAARQVGSMPDSSQTTERLETSCRHSCLRMLLMAHRIWLPHVCT